MKIPIIQAIENPYVEPLSSVRWQWTETFDSGLRKIKSENFAFIDTTLTMQYTLAEEGDPCSIIPMGPNLFNGKLVFAWRKNFEYAEIFNFQ